MRSLYLTLTASLILSACASTPAQRLAEQTAQAQAAGHPVLVYQIQTKFLSNFSPEGAYTRVQFVNTGKRPISAIAFLVVPYNQGEPVMWNVSHPAVFGAKGNFETGQRYAVLSAKPVWAGPWRRVDCVHLVGMTLQYPGGQIERVDRDQITSYLNSKIIPQNCSNPSTPGPHN